MAYQQVATLLNHFESFHHEAAGLYDHLAMDCGSDRTVMLLEYLGRHERLIERTIAESQTRLPDRVLKTWTTTTNETARLPEAIEKANVPSHALTTDDVLEIAMKLDSQAIAAYQELIDRDAPAWVTEQFQNLLDMEQQQEKLMVTQAARGSDL